ncbi:MAG: hypothetical protein H6Q76_241 [Firmicutes bacterium]|nr:hypothetical protein [Bacillota bacterium]
MPHLQNTELSLPLQAAFLPIATSCVEQSVQAFGMGRAEAMHLTLAVEEVYSFLAARTAADQRLKLLCRNGGYYAEVVCRFPQHALPVGAFNITSTVSSDDEQSLDEMGLLLAARTVDQLGISSETGEMKIRFVKNKRYPSVQEQLPDLASPGNFQEVEPETELLKQFSCRVTAKYGNQAPSFFTFPGKVADMVACGEYGAVLLADGKGNVGAGMLWRRGQKLVEAFGPYAFYDQTHMSILAVEACLRKMARTSAVCMVVQEPTADMPPGYFERLAQEGSVLYRQLEEDNGTTAYAHPQFADFLQDCYQQLYLPRAVHPVEHQGESLSPCSAFAAQMNRPVGRVTLTAIWVGKDAAPVLLEHVRALKQEGFTEIQFHLDTGVAEQAMLSPALSAAGFVTRWVLPWGGRGDILVLMLREGETL